MSLIQIFFIILIGFEYSKINNCLSMVILSTDTTTTTNDILSTLTTTTTISNEILNQKQLDLIEIQLRQRHIPYRQIQDNKDGITIIIGPFHKSKNFTASIIMFNQTRFHTNFTKIISIKSDYKNQTNTTIHIDKEQIQQENFPMTVEAHEYDLAHDQESYEFRNCLEACEIYEGNELKPDHNCIRKKCLKEITGI
ncbi:unnamed protein product [Rotaria sp. Silwood1]|nr:unnamed protein product [Rotaria sp. Silwood1]CAF5035408.1 unnamed protein product [Rotaria sp. Silwood1]